MDNADGNKRDNKDGERGGGVGDKRKDCPVLSTHNIILFKEVAIYDVRTHISFIIYLNWTSLVV